MTRPVTSEAQKCPKEKRINSFSFSRNNALSTVGVAAIGGKGKKIRKFENSRMGTTSNERFKIEKKYQSSSLTSSNALISIGPYTYIIRQPKKMKLQKESENYAPLRSINKKQKEEQEQEQQQQDEEPNKTLFSDTNSKNQQVTEEEILWTSPIVPQEELLLEEEENQLKSSSLTPVTPISSPQPRIPHITTSIEKNFECSDEMNKNKNSRFISPILPSIQSGVSVNNYCEEGISTSSTTIITNLLRRMQKRLRKGASSSNLLYQRTSSSNSTSTRNNNNNNLETLNHHKNQQIKQQQQHQHYPHQESEQQQHSNRVSSSVPPIYTDINEEHNASTRKAARHRRNEALRFIGIETKRDEGFFTESDNSLATNPSISNQESINTLEWGDRLWRGIEEDDRRMSRWLSERGILPKENILALCVFKDYLKNKADRLENEYDKLFWSSREKFDSLNYVQHKNSLTKETTEIGGNMQEISKLNHPYSINFNINSDQKSIIKNNVSTKKVNHTFSVTPNLYHNQGNSETLKNLSKKEISSEKRSKNHNFKNNISSFYTGHSLIEEEENKLNKSKKIKRSESEVLRHSSSSTSSSSISKTHTKIVGESLNEIIEKESNDNLKEKYLYFVPNFSSKTNTSNAEVSDTQQFLKEKRSIQKEILHPLIPTNDPKLKDLSSLLRLREYSNKLEEERQQLLNEKTLLHNNTNIKNNIFKNMDTSKEKTNDNNIKHHSILSPTPLNSEIIESKVLMKEEKKLPINSIPLQSYKTPKSTTDIHLSSHWSNSSISPPSSDTITGPLPISYYNKIQETNIDYSASPQFLLNHNIKKEEKEKEEMEMIHNALNTPPPSNAFTSSRYISPMPHEPRTVIINEILEKMNHARSLTVSQTSSVNQSLLHASLDHSRENILTRSPWKLKENVINNSLPHSDWSYPLQSSVSERVFIENASHLPQIAKIKEMKIDNKSHDINIDNEEYSFRQHCHTPLNKEMNQNKNNEPGSVVWSSSSSSNTKEESRNIDLKRQQKNNNKKDKNHHLDKSQKKRFGTTINTTTTSTSYPTSTTTTPINKKRSSSNISDLIEINFGKTHSSNHNVNLSESGSIPPGKVLGTQGINQTNTPTKEINNFFVRVINNTNNNNYGKSEDIKERINNDEKIGVSRSRRFGVRGNH